MSAARNDGGPAFPVHAQCGEETGMSQRNYFAAAALQGLMAKAGFDVTPHNAVEVAGILYRIADAMVAEGAK